VILYVNGDSHSHGMHLHPHEKFSDIVAKEIGFNVINAAQIGASNASILRTTREYLASGATPDLILIGWTTWEREEWYYQNQYYNVNSSGHDQLPTELQDLYKNWVIEQRPETLNAKSMYCHNLIFEFHQELTQKNIKHLFFNCMYNFFQPTRHVNWGSNFIEPYNNDASYYWWLTKQGLSADDWYHFGADGHAAWAERLIDYIQEQKII
jgi:hypothetical protein